MAIQSKSSISVISEWFCYSLTNILTITFLSTDLHIPFIPEPFKTVESYMNTNPEVFVFAIMAPIIFEFSHLVYKFSNIEKFAKIKKILKTISSVSIISLIILGKILLDQLAESPYARPYYDFELNGQWIHLPVGDMFFIAYFEVLFLLWIAYYILRKIENELNNLAQ
jgi:hypothetical protein